MALEIKQLGAGQSVAAPGTGTLLYDMAVGKSAIVRSMRFVNVSNQPAILIVYLRKGASTDHQISPSVKLAPGAIYVDNDEITLRRLTTDAGDAQSIRATATKNTVHWVVSGIERDA